MEFLIVLREALIVLAVLVVLFFVLLSVTRRAYGVGPWAPPALALAMLVIIAVGSACYTRNENSNSNINAPSQVIAPAPSPAASPSPSPGAATTGGPVSVVEVHYFGKSKGTPGKDLAVGEVGDVTASPYDAQGVDVGKPTDPVAWSCSSGLVLVQSQANHYNAQVTGKTAGAYTCTATAGGVTGSLIGTVVP